MNICVLMHYFHFHDINYYHPFDLCDNYSLFYSLGEINIVLQ